MCIPLGSDTKVISTIIEIIKRQSVDSYADEIGLQLCEPLKQNHYPDYTLGNYIREYPSIRRLPVAYPFHGS